MKLKRSIKDSVLLCQSGVTIVELFCVLALIGIMLTGTVMYFSSLSRNQALASALQEVKAIIQVGGGYLNSYGSYDGFSVDDVQKTNLIDARYNVVFFNNENPPRAMLMVPWTQQASNWSGMFIIPGSDYDNWAAFPTVPAALRNQFFILAFRQIPSWACKSLMQQMKVVSTPAPTNACAYSSVFAQTEQLEFILPKVTFE